MGIRVKSAIHLYPEEALFAMEMSALEVLYNRVPLSLQEAYAVLLPHPPKLRRYQVYSHLSRLGYTVIVHQSRLHDTDHYEKRCSPESEKPIGNQELIVRELSKSDPIILSDEDSVEVINSSTSVKPDTESVSWQHSRTSYSSVRSMSIDADNTNSESEIEMTEVCNPSDSKEFDSENDVKGVDQQQIYEDSKLIDTKCDGNVKDDGVTIDSSTNNESVVEDDNECGVHDDVQDDSDCDESDDDEVILSSELTPGLPFTVRNTSFLSAFLPSKYSYFTPGMAFYKSCAEAAANSEAEIPLITIEDSDTKPRVASNLVCKGNGESDSDDEVQIATEEEIGNKEETDCEENIIPEEETSWVLKAEIPVRNSENSVITSPVEPADNAESSQVEEDDCISFPNLAGKDSLFLSAVPEHLLPPNVKLYRDVYKISRDGFLTPGNTRPSFFRGNNRRFCRSWSNRSDRSWNSNTRWPRQNNYFSRNRHYQTQCAHDSSRSRDLVHRQNKNRWDVPEIANERSVPHAGRRHGVSRGRTDFVHRQRKTRWDMPKNAPESSVSLEETGCGGESTRPNISSSGYTDMQATEITFFPSDKVQNKNVNLPVHNYKHAHVRTFLPSHYLHHTSDHQSPSSHLDQSPSNNSYVNYSKKRANSNRDSSSQSQDRSTFIPEDLNNTSAQHPQNHTPEKDSTFNHQEQANVSDHTSPDHFNEDSDINPSFTNHRTTYYATTASTQHETDTDKPINVNEGKDSEHDNSRDLDLVHRQNKTRWDVPELDDEHQMNELRDTDMREDEQEQLKDTVHGDTDMRMDKKQDTDMRKEKQDTDMRTDILEQLNYGIHGDTDMRKDKQKQVEGGIPGDKDMRINKQEQSKDGILENMDRKKIKDEEKSKCESPDIIMLALPTNNTTEDKVILPEDCNFVSFDLGDSYQECVYTDGKVVFPDSGNDKVCPSVSGNIQSPESPPKTQTLMSNIGLSSELQTNNDENEELKFVVKSVCSENNAGTEIASSNRGTLPMIVSRHDTRQYQPSHLSLNNANQQNRRIEESRSIEHRPKTFHEAGSWRDHKAFSTAHPQKRPRREGWRDGEEYPTAIINVGVGFASWSQYKHILNSFRKMQGLGMGDEKVLYTGRIFPLIRRDDPADLDDMMTKLRIIPQVNLTFGDSSSSVSLPSRKEKMKLDFDVYLPHVNYRLSCPTPPNLRLIVVSADDPVPELNPLVQLQLPLQDGIPVYFAVVGDDTPVFYGLHDISLPDFTKPQS